MTFEAERERAIEYRRKMVARVNNRLAAEQAMHGSEPARRQNLMNWRALIPDRDGGWEPRSKVQGEPK